MISKKEIEDFLNEEFVDGDVFLVDVSINAANNIRVYVDKPLGISVKECYDVSRMITGKFDREEEDYSLDVSSPGLDMPLSVPAQFEKNIGKEIEVLLNEGEKHKGILKKYNPLAIEIEETKKVVVKDKKNKQLKTEVLTINFDDIKTVKVVISFN